MAITRSAKEAHRTALRRRVFNLRRKQTMRGVVKEISVLIGAKKGNEATALLAGAYQAIDKAAKRGVIKANTAARMKSRLTKHLRAVV